jgi:hypothetical protein
MSSIKRFELAQNIPVPASANARMFDRQTSAPLDESTLRLDSHVHAAIARASSALSPGSALLAADDWATHLSVSPGKQIELGRMALTHPFNLWNQSFLLNQQWWDAATHDSAGVERHHESLVEFAEWGIPPWRAPAAERPDGLERGRHTTAGEDALAISACS